jgi:ADP-ribosyl-[dinitrogen reductase] hydrolase
LSATTNRLVIDMFAAALWAFAPQDGFEAIILRTVNLGDDADTVAAVAGQIVGAYYGLCAIPERWLAVLAWRDDLVETGGNLFQLSA